MQCDSGRKSTSKEQKNSAIPSKKDKIREDQHKYWIEKSETKKKIRSVHSDQLDLHKIYKQFLKK